MQDHTGAARNDQPKSRLHTQLFCHRRPLYLILALAALLRLWAAQSSLGFVDPNEIYRLYEPLAAKMGYPVRLPWEWEQNLFYPAWIDAHLLLVRFFEWLGIESALSQSIGFRSLYGLLSLLCVWFSTRIIWAGTGSPYWTFAGTAWMALWPEWIFRSVRTMDYSLEASGLALALLLVVPFTGKPTSRLKWYLAGATLGALFFIRYQSGLYLIWFLFFILVSIKSWREKARYTLATLGGYVTIMAFLIGSQGLTPFKNYMTFNLLDGGAHLHYGADPWHRYITEGLKMLGSAPGILLILLLAWFIIKRIQRGRFLKPPPVPLALPLVTLTASFIVYSGISHKEDRFIIGFFWLAFPLGALLAHWAWTHQKRPLVIAASLSLLIGWFSQLDRMNQYFYVNSQEVRAFTHLGKVMAQGPDTPTGSPVIIEGDPDFLPGNFFLRTRDPLCYQNQGKTWGFCDHLERSVWKISPFPHSNDQPDPLSFFERWKLFKMK